MSQKDERAFLHDLSNPLAIAAGLLETLFEDLSNGGQLSEHQQARFMKIQNAMSRIDKMVNDRRDRVKELEASSPDSL